MPPQQFAIQSYRARALPLSAQQLINFYAEAAPRDAKDPVVLHGTPGIKTFCDNVGDGPIRAMHLMDGVLYVLSGDELWSVKSDCDNAALGSIGFARAGGDITGVTHAAEAAFTITGGTDGGGTISSITVGGEEILTAGALTFVTDEETTAGAFLTGSGLAPPVFENFRARTSGASPKVSSFQTNYRASDPGDLLIAQVMCGAEFNFPDLIAGSPETNATIKVITGPPGWTEIDQQIWSQKGGFAGHGPWDETLATDGLWFKFHAEGDSLSATWECNRNVQFNISISRISGAARVQGLGPGLFPSAIAFRESDSKDFLENPSDTPFAPSITPPGDASLLFTFIHTSSSVNQGIRYFTDPLFPAQVERFFESATNNPFAGIDTTVHCYTEPWTVFAATGPRAISATSTSKENVYHLSVTSWGTNPDYEIIPNSLHPGSIIVRRKLSADGAPSDFNGLPMVITTTGDVTVSDSVRTFAGGYSMPAVQETVGGGGLPLTKPPCVSMSHNAADPSQLIIVDGTNGWIYDTTNGLRQILDIDFFSADVVDFQDQYFILNRAGTGQWFISNLNDGTAYLATDIATAEGDPDILVGLISNRRELWLFGAETTEVWYNSGDPDFPFNRFEGGFIERGCAAAFSIAEDDNSIFWLGEDRIFYRADGYTPQRVSQHGIEEALRQYKVVEDACAFIYTMAGHKFYVITFPSEDVTWVYDITTSLWHERRSSGLGRWRVSNYVKAYGKHLVGDFEHGRVGELDLDTYAEWDDTMQGVAAGPVAHSDRKMISHRLFELDIESGVGLTTGQGSDPLIQLSYSDDGGRNFSARKPYRSMGKIGAYQQRLRWHRMGSAYNRIYQVIVSDPVKRSIIAVHLNARQGRG